MPEYLQPIGKVTHDGLDVSEFQGKIDWNRAKAAGVEFAILKVIRKDLNPDNQFENNWKGCVEAGVPIQGVYNYSYATNIAKAISDANRVLSVLGSDRHPFVWLDWEDRKNCRRHYQCVRRCDHSRRLPVRCLLRHELL